MSRRRYMLNGKEFDNGEYILRTNNLLYTKDEWNTGWNSEAVGVGLLTDNIRVVIPAKRIYDSFSSKSTVFQGVVSTTYIDIARQDFNGLSNTQNIIKQSQKDNFVVNVANKCAAFTFINGINGYVPSIGEWYECAYHMDQIDELMSLAFNFNIEYGMPNWASTAYNDISMYTWRWDLQRYESKDMTFASYAIPFGRLPFD